MFIRPGRDTTASAIEELFVEARADDDFGLRSLDLVYSVNGGPEESVSLYDSGDDTLREVSAGHTFFLEELELEPGDFLSLLTRAPSTGTSPSRTRTSRATSTSFRCAASAATTGPGPRAAAGAAGARPGATPARSPRRSGQIISATFNVIRDRATFTEDEFRENVVFLTPGPGPPARAGGDAAAAG